MFEKLLATIPYNPSMVHQLAFYSRRMREESSVRRTGLIMLVLAFLIQFFAVISPPQPTVADSTNDLINGGITSAADAKQKCDTNLQNYRTILGAFGITCAEVGTAATVSLVSTAENNNLYSMGRLPYGATNSRTGKATGETPVTIPGLPTLYVRHLSSFDTYDHSTYTALKIVNTHGTFYLLYNCGNLVSIGVPTQIPTDYCSNIAGVQASTAECDVCPNKAGIQSTAAECDVCPNKVGIQTTSADCDVCPNKAGIQTTADQCDVCSNLPGVQTTAAECDVCPNISGVQTTNTQCDVCPNISGVQTSSTQCDVCPKVTGVQSTTAECDVCPAVSGVQSTTAECDVCPKVTGVQTTTAECDVCPDVSGIQSNTSECDVCPDVAGIQSKTSQCDVCPADAGVQSSLSDCKDCQQRLSSANASACVLVTKVAQDQTTAFADPGHYTAKGGDVIEFTLTATNSGKTKVAGYVFNEQLSDTLDYSDLIDGHGGTLADDNTISWPAVDIAPGATATKTISVKVKDPIPMTPVSTSDPAHFDLVMTNVYGNAVNIFLPPTVFKSTEIATTKLVNTGPGTSLFIAAAFVIVAGYFYSRSRLLATESRIAVQENTSGGL